MDKQAAKKVLKHLAVLFAIGLAYFIFYSLTGFGIPCAFRTITTLKCPSCGVTHMFSDMLHGDFAAAFKDNVFLFCTWPVIAGLLIYADYRTAAHKKLPKWCNIIMIAFIVLLIIWGIIRNLPVFGVPGIPAGI
ncbi:MAG: DUF2752 domain-containing protein [Clostridiales bacterium]|nr:DUF2752 domain-containing protein [Clostridiales bacterium]